MPFVTLYTSIMISKEICVENKVNADRVAACFLYTSSNVAEASCLKNDKLSSQVIIDCAFKTEGNVMEQFCLLEPEVVLAGDLEFSDDLELIKHIQTKMEEFLGYGVKYSLLDGMFLFQEEQPTHPGARGKKFICHRPPGSPFSSPAYHQGVSL